MSRLSIALSLLGLAQPLAAQVTINAVVNASGYQAKLAPGVVFVIFGSGMGPASIATANGPNYPDSLAGTSVAFTPAAGGSTVTAKMIYSIAGQIAGLLPSSTAPGAYSVQVTYNNQPSAPQNVNVVARSLGIATADSSGSGNAQASIGNINGGISLTRFSSGSVSFGGHDWVLSPAHPGDTLVLWGTGGGADPANDTGGSSGDQTAAGNFVVHIGGRAVTPLYAGASSGYPGLWQVNFTIPSDLVPACFVYLQVSGGGELSNGVNIPIGAPGQNVCSDPQLTPAFLSKLDAGGTITAGSFAIAHINVPASGVTEDTASGFIGQYKVSAWLLPQIGPRFGSCIVYDRTFAVGGTDPASPTVELDAGPKLPLSGPGLAAGFALGITHIALGSFYSNSPSPGSLASGTYNLTGNGGTQVGPFATSTVFPANFTVTSSITKIDRTQPLAVAWSGSGIDRVYMQATTNTRSGSSQRIVTVNCYVPANLGTYSIPPEALAYLQPPTASVAVEGQSSPGTFTAALASGGQLDLGSFVGDLGTVLSVPVQ